LSNASGSIWLAQRPTTFAARRVDQLLGRGYSLLMLLSAAEMTINAMEQSAYLKAAFFWPSLFAVLGSIAGMAISHWFFSGSHIWYVLHLLTVAATLILWPYQIASLHALPHDYTPWVWWTLGTAVLSGGMGLTRSLGIVSIVAVPIYFGILRLSAFGGHAPMMRMVQDVVYTMLFAATMSTLVAFLRYSAADRDKAGEEAQLLAAKDAATDAVERERLRLGSIVHNQVLSALALAVDAHSPQQREAAVDAAKAAIHRLTDYPSELDNMDGSVSVPALFTALGDLVARQAPSIEISSKIEGDLQVPNDVSVAITEATLQAISNSLIHAGGPQVAREVKLRATADEVKVVIADKGKGFRPGRVPKSRLGIRIMIYRRMESVGGVAHIDSHPGDGCRVILEWSPNA
jgi:signal transduction histidine kinase